MHIIYCPENIKIALQSLSFDVKNIYDIWESKGDIKNYILWKSSQW